MIHGERKPIEDVSVKLGDAEKVLIVGCGTCVTVHGVGGEREVSVLAKALKIGAKKDGKKLSTSEETILRQCETEYCNEIKDAIAKADVVVSLACGAGVQVLCESNPDKKIVPALDTKKIGATQDDGDIQNYCGGCGDCTLDEMAGLCTKARCPKGLLNGPCGGVHEDGRCEVTGDCIWVKIFERFRQQGRLDEFTKTRMPKAR